MNPSELTIDIVREELSSLIAKYPDRRGSVPREEQFDYEYTTDNACVYYTDEKNVPITSSNFDFDQEPQLVTPVCIVGQWIESFHPEFKENELIRPILLRNSTLRACLSGEHPFNTEVIDLLAKAQDTQDDNNTWSVIQL